MITFLRWLGLLNAAIWFGGAIFFSFVGGPAFFSDDMVTLLTKPYAGAAAQVVLARYFYLHYLCGAIAIFHLGAEWLYSGKPVPGKLMLALFLAIGLALVGGLYFQPALKKLHVTMYKSPQLEERQKAEASFKMLHGISQGANLIVVAGLLFYFVQAARSSNSSRFVPTQKFRG